MTFVWMLKRASRIDPQTTKRNEAIHPRLWKSARPQECASTAGATPKETRSANESYSSPNSEVEWVQRATRPSSASSTAAAMIKIAAAVKFPSIERQIDRYPQKRFPTVNRVGRRKRPRDRRSRESRRRRTGETGTVRSKSIGRFRFGPL